MSDTDKKTESAASRRGKSIDWEAIERDYRAGVLSIREIARNHDVSDKAVRNRAGEFNWERDLSGKVQQKVRNELVRADSAPADYADKMTEREIIDNAAAQVVFVVRSHRKAITRGMEAVELLSSQLIEAATNRADLEDEIEIATKDEENPTRRNWMLKMVSLSEHAKIAAHLSNATKTWVGLERQSFSISDTDQSNPIENASDDELDRKIAAAASKAGIVLAAGGEGSPD